MEYVYEFLCAKLRTITRKQDLMLWRMAALQQFLCILKSERERKEDYLEGGESLVGIGLQDG